MVFNIGTSEAGVFNNSDNLFINTDFNGFKLKKGKFGFMKITELTFNTITANNGIFQLICFSSPDLEHEAVSDGIKIDFLQTVITNSKNFETLPNS